MVDRVQLTPSVRPLSEDQTALRQSMTALEALEQQPSQLDQFRTSTLETDTLLAQGGRRRPRGDLHTITVNAPYVTQPGGQPLLLEPGEAYTGPRHRGVVHHSQANIQIHVRELTTDQLGLLDSSKVELQRHMDAAVVRKSNEDLSDYGRTTAQLKSDAIASGYFDSPSHRAWAEAAEARTGGRISSEWWQDFDPFGGTNGNGPNLLAGGLYPHPLSRIGMAHDTDWSLGRHFNAGPLDGLYGAGFDSQTRGKYGLDPFSPLPPGEPNYTLGHLDWDVNYRHQ